MPVCSRRARAQHSRGRTARTRGREPSPPRDSVRAQEIASAPHRTAVLPYAILALLGTLLVSHHHTLILLVLPAAAIVVALFALSVRTWRRVAPGFRRPALDTRGWVWVAAAALAGLLQLLVRADYGTFRLDPLEAGHVADRSHVLLFLESIPRDFTVAGTVLIGLGGIVLARRHPRLASGVAGFLLLQTLFFTRVHFPAMPELFRGVVEHERPDVRVLEELLTRAWYVTSLARREPGLMPSFGDAGRYTGTPETGTLRWLDHLIAHRPVAFVGLKDSTFTQRYQVMPRGFVLLAYPRGSEPDIRTMADTALVLLPHMELDVAFRDYDPWSFEAESRWRFPEFAARTALLLCDPTTNDFTEDLVRYLAPGRSGPLAEEARRVLEYLDRLPR